MSYVNYIDSQKDLRNHGPISLLSVINEVFAKVITTRISDTLDSNQTGKQKASAVESRQHTRSTH